jgi:hypothetical protein
MLFNVINEMRLPDTNFAPFRFTMTTIESAPRSQWFGSRFRYSPISLFAAGFISVLVFQQGALAILNAVGFTPITAFSAAQTWPARGAANLVVGLLGRRVGSCLWVLREVVHGEVLHLLALRNPLWSDLSHLGPVVHCLPLERHSRGRGVGSDPDGHPRHDSRRLGIGNGAAAALSSIIASLPALEPGFNWRPSPQRRGMEGRDSIPPDLEVLRPPGELRVGRAGKPDKEMVDLAVPLIDLIVLSEG